RRSGRSLGRLSFRIRSRSRAVEISAHEADVFPQLIELLGVRAWNLAQDDRALDLIQAIEERLTPLRCQGLERLALESHELAVPAVNAAVHPPRVEVRQIAQAGDQYD